MSATTPETLYDDIQAQLANYPTRRGAMLPALHLTQEAYGWLSPEALIACGDAIGFSPAYCQSVAGPQFVGFTARDLESGFKR